MSFTKITSEDTAGKGVVGLADTPGLSTANMQAKFDELVNDVVIPKFNNLVDELDEMEIDERVTGDNITNIRVDADKKLQVSMDGGESYEGTGSDGHIIMNGNGSTFPARSRMQFSANTVITDDAENNVTFVQVPSGIKGDTGDSATITIGAVTNSPTPYVVNVGSPQDAIFNFGFPQGAPGTAASIQVGTVVGGNNASVSNRGTSSAAIFDFVLPKGDKGDPGTSFTINDVYATYAAMVAAHPTGSRGEAYMVEATSDVYTWGVDTEDWVNLGPLQGAKGDTGDAATVTVGNVTSGATASVTNSGTTENAILNFVLPKGDQGDPGTAATVSIGTVTKGDTPSVVNIGTSTNAIFDMVLPKGDKGDQGDPTIVNGKSGSNINIYGADVILTGYTKAQAAAAISASDSVSDALGKLEYKADTQTFTSDDDNDANITISTGYTSVSKLETGESTSGILTKISKMFKNIRYLYKLLGTTDISAIGNGTVTNAIDTINSNLSKHTISSSYTDISSYTSGNPYTVPADGYITAYGGNTGSNAQVTVAIKNGVSETAVELYSTASLYVRKGMQVYSSVPSGIGAWARYREIS